MLRCIVARSIHELHQSFEEFKLLEEVDADSLDYDLSRIEPCEFSILPYVSGSILFSSLLYYKDKCLGISSCIGTLCASLSAYGISSFLIRRQFRKFAKICYDAHRSAKSLHSNLKQRDIVSFGLGITSPAQVKHRLSVFECVRELALTVAGMSEVLVDKYELTEEKERLFRNFYSDDMRELLSDELSLNSVHIHDRGLGAVVDLVILLRSELCRLVIISSMKLRTATETLSFLMTLRRFCCDLEAILGNSQRLHMNMFNHSNKNEENRVRSNISVQKNSSLKDVANALDLIVENIHADKMEPSDIKRALGRVLDMTVLSSWQTVPVPSIQEEAVAKAHEEDSENVQIRLITEDERRPVIDQVFETVADHATEEEEPESLFEDLYPKIPNGMLMGELRNALGERSKEYELRERRALAAFYGVTEEEILRREDDEEGKEKKQEEERLGKQKEEITLEGFGEGDEGTEFVRQQRPTIPLPVDLQKALSSRFNVVEQKFGDDSDSDE